MSMHKELLEGLPEDTANCRASPATNPITSEDQQVIENATKSSDIIRIQADFTVGRVEIMEEEFAASSNNTVNKDDATHCETNTRAFDENSFASFGDLQGLPELEENPATSSLGHQTDDPIPDQKNYNHLTPITTNLCKPESDINEKEKGDWPQLPHKKSSNDFLIGGDLVNKHRQTSEPARKISPSSPLLENIVAPQKEVKLESEGKSWSKVSTSAQADNTGNNQNLESHNEQMSSDKTIQPFLEDQASEQGDDNERYVSPNETAQSTGDCEVSTPETTSDMLVDSKPILTEQTTEPDDSSKEKNKSEPNEVSISQSDTLNAVKISYVKTDEQVDVEHLRPHNSTLENQNMLTKRQHSSDKHALTSTPKCDTPALSPPNSNDRMANNIEQNPQQCDQTNSTQSSQTTAAAETFSAHRLTVTTSKRVYGKKNKPNQEPFRNSGPLQANTIILSDEEDDQNGHPQKTNAGITQFNSSTQLRPFDRQTPVLQPQKRPGVTEKYNIKFNATNDSNFERSDIEAGIMLNKLLKMRSLKNAMTLDDINEAIIQGKPNPPMLYVIEEASRLGKSKKPVENQADQQAGDGLTQKMSWVTGSHHLKQYLCWPCLLFGERLWHIPITLGLGDIVESTKNHQNTVPHLSAFMKFLVHEATFKREQEAKLERYVECTKQSELLLRLLIEIMCSNTKGSEEEHVEMLGLACSYKDNLQMFIKEKPADFLASFVASNLSSISGAVEHLLMAKILEEIKNAPFVSIIFEETTDVVDKSLMAVILRYASDSGVSKERFVKLIKMGRSRTVADFLKITNSVVQEFQLTEKLVGFTYSGTVISPTELLIFNKTVSRIYPKARFFPYQEHNLKKIITQSLSHLPECRRFLYTVNELVEFLKNDPSARKTLMAIDKVDLGDSQEGWDFVNDFITTIKHHYEPIMSFFKHIIEHKFAWDPVTVTQVEYFSRFLRSPHSRFLIWAISAVLGAVTDLCSVMEGTVDIGSWNRLLSEATNTLSDMKVIGFMTILQEIDTSKDALDYVDMSSPITPELYHQIIDICLIVINHRCVDLELAIVGLRDIEAAANREPERLATFLQRIDVYPEKFSKLKNEAESLYQNRRLADKNLEQMVKHIQKSKMVVSARLLRFLQLCQTLPTKEAYSATSRPAVLRLHSYIAKNKHPKFYDLLFFMEKDILSSLQQEKQFYDYVVEYCIKDDESRDG